MRTPTDTWIYERGELTDTRNSTVNEASILAVQVFDQKKFKKKDQGFLGVINVRIGDVMPELGDGADGMSRTRTAGASHNFDSCTC